jgi:hypothetical protein
MPYPPFIVVKGHGWGLCRNNEVITREASAPSQFHDFPFMLSSEVWALVMILFKGTASLCEYSRSSTGHRAHRVSQGHPTWDRMETGVRLQLHQIIATRPHGLAMAPSYFSLKTDGFFSCCNLSMHLHPTKETHLSLLCASSAVGLSIL